MAISLNIHPMWVIEEYAMIVRRWDWFIPSIPPTIAFSLAKENIISEIDWVNTNDITINGASFCHVERMRAASQEIEVITDGYHMWQGAIPILRTKAINIRNDINWLGKVMWNHRDMLLISKILDPSAWTRKYFTVASVSWVFFEFIKIGINLKRLSSRAVHKKSQFVLDIAIRDLVTIIDVEEIKNGVDIKTWRSWTP